MFRSAVALMILTGLGLHVVADDVAPETAPAASVDDGATTTPPSPRALRIARATAESAESTFTAATSAFRRGLMSLGDYAVHVEYATDVRTAVRRQLGQDGLQAENLRVEAYRDAVRRLEAFNQPASRGWASDLADARVLLSRAESAVVLGRGESLSNEWIERHTLLARRAVQLRLADARDGLGRPVAVAETIRHALPIGGGERTAAITDELVAAARRAADVQFRTDVGRDDELLVARGELDLLIESESSTSSDDARLLQNAYDAGARAFATAVQYHSRGTASLFDVPRAFLVSEHVVDESPEESLPLRSSETADRQRQLVRLAEATGDLRGRNRADVALVRTIALQSALASETSSQPEKSSASSTANEPAPKPSDGAATETKPENGTKPESDGKPESETKPEN